MSTLEIDHGKRRFRLWDWSATSVVHQYIRVTKSLGGGVYRGLIGPLGSQPYSSVAVKIAETDEDIDALKHEAQLYETSLAPLQGTVVPRYYGYFSGRFQEDKIAVILLQLCTGPPALDHDTHVRQLMFAASQLHQVGIAHCDLTLHRHFVPMGLEFRVIDFSNAIVHDCPNSYPGVYHARCSELKDLELKYGIQGWPREENPYKETSFTRPLRYQL